MRPCMFGLNDDGVMEETNRGIVLRISEAYGFAPDSITLMEGSYCADSEGRLCATHMAFQARGLGWVTNFGGLVERDTTWDEVEHR